MWLKYVKFQKKVITKYKSKWQINIDKMFTTKSTDMLLVWQINISRDKKGLTVTTM